MRITTQNLNVYGGFRRGGTALFELWADREENAFGQQPVGHSQEFGHAAFIVVIASQHRTHGVIDHPFHWGEHERNSHNEAPNTRKIAMVHETLVLTNEVDSAAAITHAAVIVHDLNGVSHG